MNSYAPVLTAEMAVERANTWTLTARPVVRAYLELDQIDASLLTDCDERTGTEARGPIGKAMTALLRQIEAIRDEAVADQIREPRPGASDAEWDVVESFNEQVEREVRTVAWVLKNVGGEG